MNNFDQLVTDNFNKIYNKFQNDVQTMHDAFLAHMNRTAEMFKAELSALQARQGEEILKEVQQGNS